MSDVFIISKQTSEARDVLRRYLQQLGVTVRTVGDIQVTMPGTPYISALVSEGVRSAKAIIALCEPDEQAALYNVNSHSPALAQPKEPRWQPRQNVLYEIGLAHAIDRDRILICALGEHVSLPSDLSGVLLPRLDAFDGLHVVHRWLSDRLTLPDLSTDHDLESWKNAFASLVTRRWQFHDEVEILAHTLHSCLLGDRGDGPSVLDALSDVVRTRSIDLWKRSRPLDLMKTAHVRLGNEYTDEFFWWLTMHGIFRFTDQDVWWEKKDVWNDAMWYTEISERALALFERINLGTPEPK